MGNSTGSTTVRGAWGRARAGLVVTAALLAATGSLAAAPVAVSPPEVEAGKYLAAAAHCSACHTSRADRPYAGNLPIVSRFGTMYSSNITPDPKTGVGQWSEAEFTSALRLGRGRHGEYLYPSMPYTDFTRISDADAHALWSYFRTLAPIVEKRKANDMKFPFNVRPGIAAWQALYFRPGRYVADASQSSEWNRGAYLVQGLGHCGACHTPKNLLLADKKDRALQGAPTGDFWFAPNIGGGRFSGIRDWSEAQVVAYLKTGHNDKNVAAVGPMLETIANGTAKLAESDLHAIAIYLKNQDVPAASEPAAIRPLGDERRAAGAAVYASHCATCHGADGRGLDGVAPALAGNSAVTAPGAENVVHSILSGFAGGGRWGAMPSFAATLDSQQIADVASFVRSSWGAPARTGVSTSAVNRMRDSVALADPRIQEALNCPAVPAAEIDAQTIGEVAALARSPGSETAAVPQLVRHYRQRHPAVEREHIVNVLAGTYCRDIMAQPTGSAVDRQMRVIGFIAQLATRAASIR